MVLFVDESENEKFFIVTGVLFKSKAIVDKAYKSFKKKANNISLSRRAKTLIYVEFKSFLIDNTYQKIKREMLNAVVGSKGTIIYSIYIKKDKFLKQGNKEKIYIKLLDNIVKMIKYDIDIIYDEFKITRFENMIKEIIGKNGNVKSINSGNSQLIYGLQFADNICSVIRMKISGDDKNNYYSIIKNNCVTDLNF